VHRTTAMIPFIEEMPQDAESRNSLRENGHTSPHCSDMPVGADAGGASGEPEDLVCNFTETSVRVLSPALRRDDLRPGQRSDVSG